MSRLFIVDAFVEGLFSGNPAAVVLLDDARTHRDDWMQSVAAELGLSETAFLSEAHDGVRSLRWFTPTMEVDICGHATLAAASVLMDVGDPTETFETRSGPLSWRAASDGITIDLPVDVSEVPVSSEAVARTIGRPVLRAASGQEYVVAELPSEDDVAGAHPDLDLIPTLGRTGLVITAAGVGGSDVVCRMFAPQCGIDEDPVTGSAWSALAPWWQPRVGRRFRARQLSGRGGTLLVELAGDRALLTGRTRTVIRGELLI